MRLILLNKLLERFFNSYIDISDYVNEKLNYSFEFESLWRSITRLMYKSKSWIYFQISECDQNNTNMFKIRITSRKCVYNIYNMWHILYALAVLNCDCISLKAYQACTILLL